MFLLPWIGIALIMVGLWQLGYKKRSAFLWTFTGEFLWIVSAFYRGIWDLAFVSFVFLALAARNWVCWGQKPSTKEATCVS
jgi:hypothetical protein